MAYTIHYEKGNEFEFGIKYKTKKTKRIYTMIVSFAITGLLLIHPVRTAVVEFLIPGDTAVTTQATDDFFEKLKEGQPLLEAFAEFCIQIVKNA